MQMTLCILFLNHYGAPKTFILCFCIKHNINTHHVGMMPVQLHEVRLSCSTETNLSLQTQRTRCALTLEVCDCQIWFFCWCLTKPEFTTSASARVASRAAALTQNTISKWISMSANSLLWLIRKVCANHEAQGETTNGTRAAHQRRLNPDLFLALWLPVNHCCSFQRGEWISSAPGIQRLILNCLADNFCIIAGS